MTIAKLDDFLPFVYYMVEWSLHKKKLCFDTQQLKTKMFSITEPCRDNLNPQFVIKSGYYIVPSPSSTLIKSADVKSEILSNRPKYIWKAIVTNILFSYQIFKSP